MVRKFLKLASLIFISTIFACSGNSEVDVESVIVKKITETINDIQEVSNKDFRIQLMTLGSNRDSDSFTDTLIPVEGSAVNVYRNEKLFLQIMPESAEGLYLISLWNPIEEKMISVWVTDVNTGVPHMLTYNGVTSEGIYFDATDRNWDGQPDTILERESGQTRIWLQERWQKVVKTEGRIGVIVEGNWKPIQLNRKTNEYEFSN